MKSLLAIFFFVVLAHAQSLGDFNIGDSAPENTASNKFVIEKRHGYKADARDRFVFGMDASAPHVEESLNDLVSMEDLISTLEFAAGPNWAKDYELPTEEITLMELVRLTAELNEKAVRTANADVIRSGHPETRTARWNSYYGGESGEESGNFHAAAHSNDYESGESGFNGYSESNNHYSESESGYNNNGYGENNHGYSESESGHFSEGNNYGYGENNHGYSESESGHSYGENVGAGYGSYGESGESGANSFCGAGYCYCHATAHPCPDYNGGYGAENGGAAGSANSLVGVRLFSSQRIDGYHAYNSHSAYYQRDCLLSDPYGFSARHCCSGFCVIEAFNASNPVPLQTCNPDAGDEFINNEFECVAPCDTSECGCDFIEEEIDARFNDAQSVGSDAGCGCGPRMAAAHCDCSDVVNILATCECSLLWEDHSNSYCSCGDAVHHFCTCDDWDYIDFNLDCECSNHLGCAADNHCTCAQGLELCDEGCCSTFDDLADKCGEEEHAAWIGGDKCCSAHLYAESGEGNSEGGHHHY